MGERNSERDSERGTTPRTESAARPTAYFRGWFLALIVSAWVLGGAGVVIWGAPGSVALALVATLLLTVDARGLFTLQGRLSWSHTGSGGRMLLALLLVALLPLVISYYLLVAIVRYRRGTRLRAASHPLTSAQRASETSPQSSSHTIARPTPLASSRPVGASLSAPIVVPVTRPLPSSLPPRQPASAPIATTSTETWSDAPTSAAREAAPATSRLTVAPASSAPTAERAERRERGRGRGALLVGCLAAGVCVLLLSCGMLAFAGPLRLFGAPGTRSTTRPPAALGGQGTGNGQVGATASATTSSLTPTQTATTPATPTPTTPPTATATPSMPAASMPTPHSTVAPTPRATMPPQPKPTPTPKPRPRPTPTAPPTWQQLPAWQNPPSWPTPTPIFNPPWQTAYGPSAADAQNAALLRVTLSCALGDSGAAQNICFNAPPGQRIDVVVAYRCVDPYFARERISRSLTAARDGALEWTWSPQRACQVGRAHIRLRTRDGDHVIEMRATVATGNWP